MNKKTIQILAYQITNQLKFQVKFKKTKNGLMITGSRQYFKYIQTSWRKIT